MSVTEIAYMVGYNSLGTFTSRFTRSVGDSPGRYRAKSQESGHCLADRSRSAAATPAGRTGEVRGVPCGTWYVRAAAVSVGGGTILDLPVLLALPELDNWELSGANRQVHWNRGEYPQSGLWVG